MSLVGMPHWAKAAGTDAMASTRATKAGADLQFFDLIYFLLGRANHRLPPKLSARRAKEAMKRR